MVRYIQNQLLRNRTSAKLARDYSTYIRKKIKITARQAAVFDKIDEELPSSSGIEKSNDLELENIAESASESTENLISVLKESKQTSTDDLFEYPLQELWVWINQ